MNNKTYAVNKKNITQEWSFFDASGKVLGSLAADIAKKLIGKHRADFSARANVGDKVVVTNAAKIAVTGNKLKDKIYYRHTGFPGGIRQRTLEEVLEKNPTEVIQKAVQGMLPQNKLRKERMANLYIYADESHPHGAQENGLKKETDK